MAAQRPNSVALRVPRSGRGETLVYEDISYQELDERSDRLARGLERIGIGRGVRTALMVRPGRELFALVFAIFKVGAVPVMVDPGLGLRSLKRCLAHAAPEAFIGIPAAHAARIALGWARGTLETLVTVGGPKLFGGQTLEQVEKLGSGEGAYVMPDTRGEEVAGIVFTSGSTGVPKGVVYNHGNFIGQLFAIRDMYRIEPGEVDLPTFPLFALFDPALGMTTVVPKMDPTKPARVDPRNIIEAINRYGVTNMFGSPALLNTVARYGVEQGVTLPSLKRVISAGAPVPAATMARLHQMLGEEAEIVTPYGATESLPIASIGSREVLGETAELTKHGAGVCVGRPVPSAEVEVIRITDDPIAAWDEAEKLPVGEVGELVVKGPMVTRRYYNLPAHTARAKVREGESVRHRMGDVGYFDEQGRVWFCGRKSQRVLTAKGTLFTTPVESIFNVHPDVYRTALVGLTDTRSAELQQDALGHDSAARSATTDHGGDIAQQPKVPVLCYELDPGSKRASRKRIEEELRELALRHEMTRAIRQFEHFQSFPTDVRHNSKIRREVLREQVARRCEERTR